MSLGGRRGRRGRWRGRHRAPSVDSYRASSSEEELSSEDTSNDDDQDILTNKRLNKKEIFHSVVRNHGGIIRFKDFRTSFPQFRNVNDLVKFLYQQKRTYTLFKRGRKIVYVGVYHKGASYCLDYARVSQRKKCINTQCSDFHICKYYLSGFCRFGDSCQLSHSFSDIHNGTIKSRLELNDYSDEELAILLRCCYPQICIDSSNSCSHGEDCPYLHVCHFYARGDCTRSNCRFSHNINDEHNGWIQKAFPKARVDIGHDDLLQSIPFPRPKTDVPNSRLKRAVSTPVLSSQLQFFSEVSQATTSLSPASDSAVQSSICLSHLDGKCSSPDACGHMHNLQSTLPYIWQIKMNGKWRNIPKRYTEDVERQYCELGNVVMIELDINEKKNCRVNIHLNPMTGYYGKQGYDVRRLSTPSFVAKAETDPAGFYTQWRWYFKDDKNKWKKYKKDAEQYTLEKKFVSGQASYSFSRRGDLFRYKVDFKAMTQFNTGTSRIREMLRRPIFISKQHVTSKQYPVPITIQNIPEPPPASWAPWDMSETDFELVELDPGHAEFMDVSRSFFRTIDKKQFTITGIERVQNRKLWSQYNIKLKTMIDVQERGDDRDSLERSLFHGTDSPEACRGICTNSFDFRISGKNATVYGEGSYFARDSKYSHAYTSRDQNGERLMFRAKVLVGKYTKGHKSYRRPPEIKGGCHKLYDSCVDNPHDPTIFVIFDRAQCYPEYLITYQERIKLSRHERRYRSSSNLADSACACGNRKTYDFKGEF